MEKYPMPLLEKEEARELFEYFAHRVKTRKSLKDHRDVAVPVLQEIECSETVLEELISIAGKHAHIVPSGIPHIDLSELETSYPGNVFLKSDDALNDLYCYLECSKKSEADIYCEFILEQQHFNRMKKGRISHLEYIRDNLLPKLQQENEDSTRIVKALGSKEKKNEKEEKQWKEEIEKADLMEREIKALIAKLRGLAFIPNKEGNLQKACKYFDPREDVFQAMHPAEDFPLKPFNTDKWLGFLRRVGLECTVTRDMFIKYAQQVESKAVGHCNDPNLAIQSKALIRHLWNMKWTDLKSATYMNVENIEFIEKVKEIEFIPSVKATNRLLQLHPQHSNLEKMAFVKLHGSVMNVKENIELAWSSAVIIPDWTKPDSKSRLEKDDDKIREKFDRYFNFTEKVIQKFGIFSRPNEDMIIANLKLVCKNVTDDTNFDGLSDTIVTVFKELQSRTLIEGQVNQLRYLNCIPVENGKVLLKPMQVVHELPDEIPPYLYQLPKNIAQFEGLCKRLKISKVATKAHYCTVLQTLHQELCDKEQGAKERRDKQYHNEEHTDKEQGDEDHGEKEHADKKHGEEERNDKEQGENKLDKSRMGRNELLSSFKAFGGLVDVFNKNLPQSDEEKPEPEIDMLYLPTKDHHLVLSNEAILADDEFLERRVSARTGIKYILTNVQFKDFYKKSIPTKMLKKFIKKLPKNLRPALLSRAFEERMVEHEKEISVEFAKKISERLKSHKLQEGLLRLIIQKADQEDEEDEIDEKERENKEILDTLGKLRITAKAEIETYLTSEGKKISGSEEKQQFFYNSHKDVEGNVEKCTLFVINKTVLMKLSESAKKIGSGTTGNDHDYDGDYKDDDDFWEVFGIFIDEVSGHRIGKNVIHLKKMFTMNPKNVRSFLDGKKIPRLDSSVSASLISTPGDPGDAIEEHVIHYDQLHFAKGEYVGMIIIFCCCWHKLYLDFMPKE